ncbi:hypothetical protein [Micromonospora marina]|uniref:hypothetical protein n=1 Tax=Micromonospora marina TaxID=307120 RepID=UPI003D74E02B
MFGNGTLYVKAGTMTQVMSWLIDFVVCLFAVAVGVVALSVVDRAVTLSGGALAGAALSLFVLVPVLFVVLMVSAQYRFVGDTRFARADQHRPGRHPTPQRRGHPLTRHRDGRRRPVHRLASRAWSTCGTSPSGWRWTNRSATTCRWRLLTL